MLLAPLFRTGMDVSRRAWVSTNPKLRGEVELQLQNTLRLTVWHPGWAEEHPFSQAASISLKLTAAPPSRPGALG